jgi:hypothetical protein
MALMLPTIGEQLGPGLNTLIEGINHAINPDYKFQQAMKAQLATNPQLVKSLADLEVQAPGTLKGLGFGSLVKLLQGVPESPEGAFQRTSSADILAGKQAELGANTTAAKLSTNQHALVLKALSNPDDPSLAHAYVERVLTGENPEERAATAARARQETAIAQYKEAELPGLLEQVKSKQTQLESFMNNYPKLKDADPVDLINDVMAGRKTPIDLAQYAMREGGKEALDTARSIAEMKYRIAESKANRALSQKLDPTERANIQTAAVMARKSHIGDVDTWRQVLENPESIDALRKKKSGDLTDDEKNLLKADDARTLMLQEQDQHDQLEQAKTQAQTIVAMRQSEQAARASIAKDHSQAGIEAGLAPLNQLIGAQGYRAKFGLPPKIGEVDKYDRQRAGTLNLTKDWFEPGNQIFYVDANNKRVNDNVPFVNKGYANQQKAQNFIQQYNGDKDPASRKGNLDALKKDHPDVYKLIAPYIKE